jgi:diaminopimelate epimerase
MDSILFSKMSGSGNDFIVIDKNLNPVFNLTEKIIQKLCNRRTGIGGDGIITIEDTDEFDFEMNYYNADGSFGSLCGNGARCGIKFASLTDRFANSECRFIANGVEYTGKVLDNDSVLFNLNPPKKIKYNFKIKAFGQLINACYADTGSPHVVVNINDVEKNPKVSGIKFTDLNDFPVIQIGKELRYADEFSPVGTNVNFILVDDGKVNIRTYERGVEDETWACGTGSVAAALITYVSHNLKPPITIIPKSLQELIVNFEVVNNKVKNLSLTGPAELIFTGQIPLKILS